jgi:hypothetical protein
MAACCVVALVAAGGAFSAPTAVVTHSCGQVGSRFSVHLAGDKGSNFWLNVHRDVAAAIPPERTMLAVWSFGSGSTGPVLYGWAANSRPNLTRRCRPRSSPQPPDGALRPVFRVKDGWAVGRRYECARRGSIVIRAETVRRVVRFIVWMERSRELIAVGEVGPSAGWLRASARCAERAE